MREARSFLGKPEQVRATVRPAAPRPREGRGSKREKAARLFSGAKPFRGTPAHRYLRNRDIERFGPALAFHPACFLRDTDTGEFTKLPALLARITDTDGQITGVARTWLDAERGSVADIADPKRVMGDLRGHAVRFASFSVR